MLDYFMLAPTLSLTLTLCVTVQELLVSPSLLAHYSVPVLKFCQYPGEIVINFSGAASLKFSRKRLDLLYAQQYTSTEYGAQLTRNRLTSARDMQGPTTQASTTVTTARSPPISRHARGSSTVCTRTAASAEKMRWLSTCACSRMSPPRACAS